MKDKLKLGLHISGEIILGLCLTILTCRCTDFLDIELPNSRIVGTAVFNNEKMATSAVTGIYNDMFSSNGFASGSNRGAGSLAGLSSDELINHTSIADLEEVQENSISPLNKLVPNLWSSAYKTIYNANAVIAGVANATDLNVETKNQLEGEAKFIRGFAYFYLANLFGDVPLILTTDYNSNRSVHRTPISQVYTQIVADLRDAQALLPEQYVTSGRVRPNRYAATAMLARVHLFQGQWDQAEAEASKVLINPQYQLEKDLDKVFLANSTEAIWQIWPVHSGFNTWEGTYYNRASTLGNYSLNTSLVNSIEAGDSRHVNWIASFDNGGETIYYPSKYKVQYSSARTEYSMVLRLAEQYFIRAEALAHKGQLEKAITDLDAIRLRASLPLIQDVNPGISKEQLIAAIQQERRIELFSEHGHRWFDLKRTGMATETLKSKGTFGPEDLLYPIPQDEINKNSNLKPQNPGY